MAVKILAFLSIIGVISTYNKVIIEGALPPRDIHITVTLDPCPENEIFSDCVCDPMCDHPYMEVECSAPDCSSGCACQDDFLRDEQGECVARDICVSKADEEMSICKPDLHSLMNCYCPSCENCTTLEQRIQCNNLVCVLGCKDCSGCNSTKCGNSLESCGITLHENEVYNNCSPLCGYEMTCIGHVYDFESGCNHAPEDLMKCIPRRECKAGYARNDTGICVKLETCCGDPNAEVVACPNPCPGGTCEAPEFSKCKDACSIKGCQCKKGYVKNYEDNCVLLKDCPKND